MNVGDLDIKNTKSKHIMDHLYIINDTDLYDTDSQCNSFDSLSSLKNNKTNQTQSQILYWRLKIIRFFKKTLHSINNLI